MESIRPVFFVMAHVTVPGLGPPPFFSGNHDQWLFLVPLKGGRWHSPSPNWQERYHLYTTYILPSGGVHNPYNLLWEPETTIECW